jgi:HAMP domain-containing protein
MAGTERRHMRPSLGMQIFLVCALLIVLAVGGAVVVTYVQGRSIAEDSVRRSLDTSAGMQANRKEAQLRDVQNIVQFIAQDAAIVQYFESSTDLALGLGDPLDGAASLADLLAERQEQYGFDLGIFLGADGDVLARSDQRDLVKGNLAEDDFLTAAIEGPQAVSGVWRQESVLYLAAAMPIQRDGDLLGFLVLADAIDDAFAAEISRLSGADVSYLFVDGDRTTLGVSSLDPAHREDLLHALAEREDVRAAITGAKALAHIDLVVDGRQWIGQLAPVDVDAGGRLGASLSLSSRDRAYAGFQRILNLVLATGLGSLLAALPLSFLLARVLLKPVRTLADAAESAAKGNYQTRLGMAGNDELARLSHAFDRLLSDLREKSDIEGYVANLSRFLPDPAAERSVRTPPPSQQAVTVVSAPGRAEPSGSLPGNPTAARGDAGTLQSVRSGAAPIAIGGIFAGRYEILSELGAGGMGVVYKARDIELDDIVAIKMLRGAGLMDAEQLDRLKSELKLARKITHPNVLRTFDFGESDGRPYISMEYVRGMTLRYLIRQAGRIPFSAGLRIARQLCAGLGAAHEVGVLHRDIKPENLILEASGNAKLMDFGIARPIRRSGPGHTQQGMFVGTPHYAAPEQLAGEEVDHRADIYASGVLLCEMFCGKLPFTGSNTMEIYMAQMQQEPVRPSAHWPDIPPKLEALILRCISRRVEDRFQDVAQVAAALAELRA